MKHLKTYKIFESVDRKFVSDFLLDFGFLISMKFSQIIKIGIDEIAKYYNTTISPLPADLASVFQGNN